MNKLTLLHIAKAVSNLLHSCGYTDKDIETVIEFIKQTLEVSKRIR